MKELHLSYPENGPPQLIVTVPVVMGLPVDGRITVTCGQLLATNVSGLPAIDEMIVDKDLPILSTADLLDRMFS